MVTVAELQKAAKKAGIPCRSRMRKATLQSALSGTLDPREGGKTCAKYLEGIQKPIQRSRRRSSSGADPRPPKGRPCTERVPEGYDLKRHQLRIVRKIEKVPGLLVAHGTGCGKTLAAGVASQCYLDGAPGSRVVFVSPAGLLQQFEEGMIMDKLGGYHASRYRGYSFAKLAYAYKKAKKQGVRAPSCEGGMLIVDEAHNIRARIALGPHPQGVQAAAVQRLATTARKRLLLTATPFYNSVQDFVNLLNILYGMTIVEHKTRSARRSAPFALGKELDADAEDVLRVLLSGRVDYIPDCSTEPTLRSEFPIVRDRYIAVPMSRAYEAAYRSQVAPRTGSFGANPEKFYHAYRQAVSSLKKDGKTDLSMKVRAAIARIRAQMKRKNTEVFPQTLIFTNWRTHGVAPTLRVLNEAGIDARAITGATRKEERVSLRDAFNNPKSPDHFPVLVITRAAGEGLDLRGVRNVVVLDPVWNQSGMQQIIGRAVRYRSHSHLPFPERKVEVFKMVLTFPKKGSKSGGGGGGGGGGKSRSRGGVWVAPEEGDKPDPRKETGDELVYGVVHHKQKQLMKIDKILKAASKPRAPLVRIGEPGYIKKLKQAVKDECRSARGEKRHEEEKALRKRLRAAKKSAKMGGRKKTTDFERLERAKAKIRSQKDKQRRRGM